MLETAHNHGLVCQKMRTDTSFLTANMSHSTFTKSKTMETFHPDMSTYVKSCTRTRPRKSKWCRDIVVSCCGQSFFVVSRYFACESAGAVSLAVLIMFVGQSCLSFLPRKRVSQTAMSRGHR